MTVEKRGVGLVERFSVPPGLTLTPPTTATATKSARPGHASGQGLIVEMAPIPSVTPQGIFLNEQPLVFQCPPLDSFGEDGGMTFDDYRTVNDGTHSMPSSGPDLKTISFTTLFVDWQPDWSMLKQRGWSPDPQAFVNEMKRIRDAGKPFRLLAHQSNFRNKYEVDWPATLRSVRWEMRGGEEDAYYVTVSFSEYRQPGIQKFLVAPQHHPSLPAKLPVKKLPANRNTLAEMARFYYGDPSKWKQIAATNGIKNVSPNTKITTKNVHSRSTITVPVLKKKK